MEADGASPDEASALVSSLIAHVQLGDPLHALVSARERALLAYALKLTRTPAKMAPGDVDRLRAAELDDGEILDAAHVVGYYAYANRIADGLGIAVEPYRR